MKSKLLSFSFILNIIFMSLIFLGAFIWADTNGVWHETKDIRTGTFGSDENDTFSSFYFINPVVFNDEVVLNNSRNCVGKLITDENGTIFCTNATLSNIRCEPGKTLIGFYENGSMICERMHTYLWRENNNWGTCSKTCGGGVQYQTASCVRNDNISVNDEYCDILTKPVLSRSCNTQSCLSWYTYHWGQGCSCSSYSTPNPETGANSCPVGTVPTRRLISSFACGGGVGGCNLNCQVTCEATGDGNSWGDCSGSPAAKYS